MRSKILMVTYGMICLLNASKIFYNALFLIGYFFKLQNHERIVKLDEGKFSHLHIPFRSLLY